MLEPGTLEPLKVVCSFDPRQENGRIELELLGVRSMLGLDDPRWANLEHAYGLAAELPLKLARLKTGKGLTDAYWETLWSSLCHQNSTYSASFAAFPHLVAAARSLKGKQRFAALNLAAGILACSMDGDQITNRIPKDLKSAFLKAIQDGKGVVAEMVFDRRRSDLEMMKFLGIVSAFAGRPKVVGLLSTVSCDFVCPVCGEDIRDPYSSLSDL